MPSEAASTQDQTGFRLSPQQELLFASGANDPGFRSQIAVRVEEADPSRLRAALAAAVRRHEILRTVFVRRTGMQLPTQVILDDLAVSWNGDPVGVAVDDLIAGEARFEFDLEHGPCVRGAVAADPDGSSVLVLTVPSVIADADSLLVIAREIVGEADGSEPLQYADYAEWRNENADEPSTGGEQDDPASPTLLFGVRVAETEPFAPERVALSLDGLTARVAQAASSCNVERAIFVEACWHACVARLSGAPTVAVGGVTDGRSHAELAGAVGPFAQPVAITTRYEEQTSLPEIADQVRRARQHGAERTDRSTAAGLGAVVEKGRIAFQAVGAGLDAEVLSLRAAASRFALQLTWLETDTPTAFLDYDPKAYAGRDAEQIATAFRILLEAAAESPSAVVEDLPIAPTTRDAWFELVAGEVALDVPQRPFHVLFEEQAERAPDRVAARAGDESVTYRELNGRANALARRLRHLGVTRDEAVGMCMHRSVGSLVALLGIIKAGGAYLPLNFEHPASRLAHQLTEAAVRVVVVESDLAERVPAFDGELLDIETIDSEEPANPEPVNEPGDLVYVMYTSGSTGLPKGVAVTHANLVNYSTSIAERLGLAGGDALQFAVVSAISTDLGNTAIFPALLHGGCVNLVSPEAAMDAEAFAVLAQEIGFDVLKITPSHLAALLAGSDSEAVLPRTCLVVGGEALGWELVSEIRSRAPSLRVVDHYGPTETTIGSCTFDLSEDVSGWHPRTVPIGRPIANTRAYVLDGRDRLLPAGVAGELVIGGAGVARGYVNRPDETAERFVDDPLAPGGRVYRTGDRVRYLPDGTIEFLGRVDNQVKIRGFRVEPAEVEAALARHHSVRQAAVKASEDPTGALRLVGYVVGWSDASTEDLHAFLAESLPDYMIPSAIVALDLLPLTPSGKVDRLALPDPAVADAEREVRYVAPRDEIEEEITRIWAELLGLERVGVDDDFFELGGHSLLATQVIMRVRRTYGDVPLQAMFMSPTPAGLAEVVRSRAGEAEAVS
jgi:amino acid adenylation domain-containing protein